jgi:hypothetical protein
VPKFAAEVMHNVSTGETDGGFLGDSFLFDVAGCATSHKVFPAGCTAFYSPPRLQQFV